MRRKYKGFVDILQYLIMFIVFAYGYSVYARMLPGNEYLYVSIIFCVLLFVLIIVNGKLWTPDLLKSLLLSLYLGIFYLFNINNNSLGAALFRLYVPLVLWIIYLGDQYRQGKALVIFKKYSDIVVAFALVSVVLYLFGTVLHLLPSSIDYYYWRGTTLSANNYFHLMYEAQEEQFFGMKLIRNCGIFCEAPGYATPLCLSLSYELFGAPKLNKTRVGILLLTVLTTWSTKAICIALCIVLFKMMKIVFAKERKGRGFLVIFKLLFPFIIGFAIIIAIAVLSNKMQQHSFLLRVDSVTASLKVFRQNLLFGCGIENEQAIYAYLTVSAAYTGLSMGLTTLLAEGGIVLFAIYIYGAVHAIRNSDQKNDVIYFILTFILILFTSNIPFFLSTTTVLAMGISIPQNKALDRRKQSL